MLAVTATIEGLIPRDSLNMATILVRWPSMLAQFSTCNYKVKILLQYIAYALPCSHPGTGFCPASSCQGLPCWSSPSSSCSNGLHYELRAESLKIYSTLHIHWHIEICKLRLLSGITWQTNYIFKLAHCQEQIACTHSTWRWFCSLQTTIKS